MNDKTKAILEITAPTGQEFVEKGAIVNQTKGLNGVCVELYIPTKAIQKPVDTDSLQDQIAQAEADKKAYPDVWFYGWEFKSYSGEKWLRYGVDNIGWFDGRDIRRHPHANLIMQCAQDKIDYPEFWHELTQWSNLNEDNWHGVPFDSDTLYEFNRYRQHPHRKNIIKFHACSEADKKRWEYFDAGINWINCTADGCGSPMWREDIEYRLRPRVCFITLQDGTRMEYPEPVREALNFGDVYWCVYQYGKVSSQTWINYSDICKKALEIGLIHLTQEAAQQHLSAIKAMNAQVAI